MDIARLVLLHGGMDKCETIKRENNGKQKNECYKIPKMPNIIEDTSVGVSYVGGHFRKIGL